MLNPQDRSRAFNFALKSQEIFGLIMGLVVLWSIYALVFTQIEISFISKILLSLICIGFGTITPLIDFNESHATNPLWTGHARFHLVWQVNAMILTAILSLFLLWAYDSFFNLVLVIILNYLWIFSFFITSVSIKLYDGEFNDINGVPPIIFNFFGKQIEVDRNVQAISAVFLINSYVFIIIF